MIKSDFTYRFLQIILILLLLPIGNLQAYQLMGSSCNVNHNPALFVSAKADSGKKSTNDCEVKVEVTHFSLFYKDITSPEFTGYPNVSTTCGSVASLSYLDQTYRLSCSSRGEGGYFSTERWAVSKIIGDGGVDVTGAPNSILVEGASVAQVKAGAGSWTQFLIEIPVEGFLTFSLRGIGGSHLIWVRINDRLFPLSAEELYFSPLLHAGDAFGVWIPGENHQDLGKYLEDFQPITNAMAVISREWQVGSTKGKTTSAIQYIALEKGSLANIIVPENLPQRNVSPDLAKPEFTGYPILDKDGDPNTTDDQTLLDQDEVYKVQWADEIIKKGNRQLLLRHWQITDTCAESIMHEIQVIPLENLEANPGKDKPVESTSRSPSSSSFIQDLSATGSLAYSLDF